MKKLVVFVFGSLFLFTRVVESADAFVTKNLNFRAGPSIQSAFRGLIPAGDLVFVQICRGNWCHVKYNTKIGWVSSRYLSFKEGNDLYRAYTILSFKHHSHYP
ncbi:SH3 domain-containing protein [Bartonella sp. CB175]|uniref:SH3 domain-containing protein n=1 Tax=Bartonella sp. CB175 TaxID=3112256 RepID=UPI00300E3F35